jgi:nitric oxide reductase large subunit
MDRPNARGEQVVDGAGDRIRAVLWSPGVARPGNLFCGAPIPKVVRAADGATLFPADQICHGQQAWLAAGGQQLGTVWGHASGGRETVNRTASVVPIVQISVSCGVSTKDIDLATNSGAKILQQRVKDAQRPLTLQS